MLDSLYLIGDIHGDFEELAYTLSRKCIQGAALVQVGDFGVGFAKVKDEFNELRILDTFLKGAGNMLYVIRGNHDDPSYFTGFSPFSNIQYLPDYSLLGLGDLAVLCVGGAISVDRSRRVAGENYWSDEGFRFDEENLLQVLHSVQSLDLVVTHTAPKEFWPFAYDYIVNAFAGRDPELITDLENERKQLSQFLNTMLDKGRKPKAWYYGHFHTHETGIAKGIHYQALGIMEIVEVKLQ